MRGAPGHIAVSKIPEWAYTKIDEEDRTAGGIPDDDLDDWLPALSVD